MTNRPLSRHSLPPVFPKIVMLVSTQFICLYLKKQDINIINLPARLIQPCFGMLKPGIMSSIWYLLPSSKGTQWGECAGAVSVPQWPKLSRDRCPAVFLFLACCVHHYSGMVKRWISGGKFINQIPQTGCCMNITSETSLLYLFQNHYYRYLQKSFSKTENITFYIYWKIHEQNTIA